MTMKPPGLVAAAGREVREILSETTARHAKQRIIDVTTAVELAAYDRIAPYHPHRFRIAGAGTLGLAAALGASIAGLLYLALSNRLGLAEAATAAGALLSSANAS